MHSELKFFADESVERRIVLALRKQHDVDYVAESMKGAKDESVLENAEVVKRILLTADKDFGELVYYRQQLHSGVVLYRLHGLPIEEKISLILSAIERYDIELSNSFTVIQPNNIRIRKQQP